MQSTTKKITIGLSALVTLLLLCAGLFMAIFKANQFRQQFFKTIQTSTGYRTQASQDISWSLSPWIGISLHQLVLTPSNPKQPTITIDHTHVLISLPELLLGRITAHTLELKGVHILTHKPINLDRTLAWLHTRINQWPPSLPSLNLKITQGEILDRHSTPLTKKWEMQVHNINADQAFTFSSVLENSYGEFTCSALVSTDNNLLNLRNLHFLFRKNKKTPVQRISANLSLAPDTHQVKLSDATYDSASFHLQGHLSLKDWHHPSQAWEGKFIIPNSQLNNYLKAHHIPNYFGTHALQSFESAIKFQPNLVTLDGKLDQQAFEGQLTFPDKKLTLNFKTFKIHHYLPHLAPPANARFGPYPLVLPKTILFNVEQALYHTLAMHDLSVTFVPTEKSWTFSPLSAKLFQGNVHGQCAIDAAPPYQTRLQLVFDNIDPTPLLSWLNASLTFDGRVHAMLSATTKHLFSDQWLTALTGHGSLSAKPGTLSHLAWRTWYKKIPQLSPSPLHPTVDTLQVSRLHTTFMLTKNQLNTDSFTFESHALHAHGLGLIDLKNRMLNYTLTLSTPTIQRGLPIEFKFFGPLKNPTIVPNLDKKLSKPLLKLTYDRDRQTTH